MVTLESRFTRYGIAVAAIAIATALRLLLNPLFGDSFPFATLFLAILLTVWWSGFGPAILATMLGGIAASMFLMPTPGTFVPHPYEQEAGLVLYGIIGLGIAACGGMMHAAQRSARAHAISQEKALGSHRRMEEQLSLLVKASETLTTTLYPESVLDAIIQLSQRLLPADAHAIWRFQASTSHWGIQAASGLSEAYQRRTVATLDKAPQLSETPLVADDVMIVPSLAERRAAYQAEGIRSLLSVPLRVRGQLCGTLAVYQRKPRHFGEDQVRMAAALANLAGTALGSAELYDEQAHAKAEAQRQRELYRITLSSIGDAVIATDDTGRITFLNHVAEQLTGWKTAHALGKPLDEVFRIQNERTRQPVESPVTKALREGTVVGLANHTVLIAKDGMERPIDDSAAPIRGADGEIIGVVLIFRDVTERRGADDARRRLAAIVEFSDDAIVGKDLRGTITSWNVGAERVYGYAADEIIGQPFSLLVPADRANEVADFVTRLRRGEHLDHFETVRRRKDGTLIDVSVSYSPIRDRDGDLIGTAVITRDITARKLADANLRASEERLRLALNAGRMGVWEWNLKTNAIRWSDNLEQIHGLANGSFGGTFDDFQRLVHPDDREFVSHAIRRALETKTGFDVEFRNLWPDGSVHWMAGKGHVQVANGVPTRMIGVGMDITQHKRSELDSRFLADASAVLAGLVDPEGTLENLARLAVPAFADWCAVDMLDDKGNLKRVAVAHVDPAKVQLAREYQRRYPPDPDGNYGAWHVLRTGKGELTSQITDEMLAASILDQQQLHILRRLGLRSYIGVPLSVRGKVIGVLTFVAAESGRRYDPETLAVAEDLAHRAGIALENAHLYQEVRAADRRKENFLSLLAHELRNPLAPIRNGIEIAKRSIGNGETLRKAIGMMERQVQQLIRLVDDLLDVSRIMRNKVELRKEPMDLRHAITRAIETAQPAIDAAGHRLNVDVPPDPILLDGDLVRLTQVISNLLNNAARYTERQGDITLCAKRTPSHAVVTVRDTGIGIPPEVLPRIWDMFMQAAQGRKVAQGGMGIGLTLVRSLVEMHGGTVEAHSEGLGKGSEFVVRLPLLQQAPQKNGPPAAVRPLRDVPPRRVLVVDDNVDAAESLASLLRFAGHEAKTAHDGPTALRLAEQEPPEIVFLDLGMPEMDGIEVAKRMRANPCLKETVLVALTGWGQEEDRRRTLAAGFDAHQVKPVDPADLVAFLNHPRLASCVRD